jgi:hypothetical protein
MYSRYGDGCHDRSVEMVCGKKKKTALAGCFPSFIHVGGSEASLWEKLRRRRSGLKGGLALKLGQGGKYCAHVRLVYEIGHIGCWAPVGAFRIIVTSPIGP